MRVHWKIRFFGGEVTKKQYTGEEFPKKGGAWTVCRFKGRSKIKGQREVS